MCGRYALFTKEHDLVAAFALDQVGFRVEARYNVAPGQYVILVRPDGSGGRNLALARAGQVPSWAKDPGPRPINARAERVAEKPTFRGALRHGRCLIPASGFYEWQGQQPFFIRPTHARPFAFAGLMDTWPGPTGDLQTCTILTTTPNEVMAPIHDRMPVILPPEAWGAWLDPATPVAEAQRWLLPCPAQDMKAHRVGRRVGKVANDDPGLVEELRDLGLD